ncbi:MAG: thioredoxin family protein [Deltaproteobacteria bacterium]|nr:thioredoxin family protein [Deltaproteobacteria bacterium]
MPEGVKQKAEVGGLNKNPKISEKLGIRGIHTLMFFKRGRLVDKLIGMVPKSIVEDAMRKCLAGSELADPFMGQ